MIERCEVRAKLIDYLRTIAKPGGRIEEAGDTINLFDEGYLDSLAVIQIVVHLEQEHGLSLAERNIDPADLASIGAILDVIERPSP